MVFYDSVEAVCPEWCGDQGFKKETMGYEAETKLPAELFSLVRSHSIKSIYGAGCSAITGFTGLMSVVAKGSRPARVVTVLMHEEKPQNSHRQQWNSQRFPTNLSFEIFFKKIFNKFQLVSTPFEKSDCQNGPFLG